MVFGLITVVCFILMLIWLAVSDANKYLLLKALNSKIKQIPTSSEEIKYLDKNKLEKYTREFLELGFEIIGEYKKVNKEINQITIYSRIYYNQKLQCLAIANQFCVNREIKGNDFTRLKCTILSVCEDGWCYQTSDRIPTSTYYAYSTPKSLWECNPKFTPNELLALHLKRRNEIIETLGLTILNVPTVDKYNELIDKYKEDEITIVTHSSMLLYELNKLYFKLFPQYQWMGNYSYHKNAKK